MTDDLPTARRSDRHGSGRRSSSPAPDDSRRGYRQQRRASQRRRRRGRALWLVLGLLIVAALVIGGVMLAPRLFASAPRANTPTSTSAAVAAGGVVLLRVLEGPRAPVLVFVAPGNAPSAVLGLPGDTLLQGDKGFEQFDDLLVSEGIAGVAGPAAVVTGLRPGAVAAVSWADLRAALTAAGVPKTFAADLAAGGTAMAQEAAEALAALAATLDTDKGKAALAALALTGDGAALRGALLAIGPDVGVVAGLPGREVEGVGFTYYEADTSAAKELLGVKEPTTAISVEVRNGSGAVDVAERALTAIRPLGYEMLPIKNAQDFPDVQITQVLAGPASLAEADRVRAAIGAGKVIKQDSLPPGQVVVIVGSDLTVDIIRKAAATSTTALPASGPATTAKPPGATTTGTG